VPHTFPKLLTDDILFVFRT